VVRVWCRFGGTNVAVRRAHGDCGCVVDATSSLSVPLVLELIISPLKGATASPAFWTGRAGPPWPLPGPSRRYDVGARYALCYKPHWR